MQSKKVSFILKGKEFNYNVVTFESIKEAQQLLAGDLLNVINLGNSVYAKAQALGKNPFKKRKTKYTLDTSKLDDELIQKLAALGALSP